MDLPPSLVPAASAGILRLPTGADHHGTRLTLDDPALELMTDFARVPPIGVDAGTSIDEALQGMKLSGVRFLFVVDGAALAGSVTASDILGEKPLLYLRSLDGTLGSRTHGEIRVGDIMEPVAEWMVLLRPRIERMRVRHLADLFVETGRRHLVVVRPEAEARAATVCGLFSATQLEREVGLTLGEPVRAQRFADLQRALAH